MRTRMNPKRRRWLVCAAALLAPSSRGAAEPWREAISANGKYRVRVQQPQAVAKVGTYLGWTVIVRDVDGRRADVSLRVRGGMPAHGHELPTSPEVRRVAAGEFLVEGLLFNMPGEWVVIFDMAEHRTMPQRAIIRFNLES